MILPKFYKNSIGFDKINKLKDILLNKNKYKSFFHNKGKYKNKPNFNKISIYLNIGASTVRQYYYSSGKSSREYRKEKNKEYRQKNNEYCKSKSKEWRDKNYEKRKDEWNKRRRELYKLQKVKKLSENLNLSLSNDFLLKYNNVKFSNINMELIKNEF